MGNRFEKLQRGLLRDARSNFVLADSIEVGVIYWETFGTEAARAYLLLSGVPVSVATRILGGPRRHCDAMP